MSVTPVPTAFYVCGRCLTREDQSFVIGTTTRSGICSRCGGQAAWMVDSRIEEPRMAYHGGSPVCSTDCSLLPYPLVIWDVNGYYARLGVDPRASKQELAAAYQRVEGWRDSWLTYVFKLLLDPALRARYDACQFGEVFIDQFVIQETLRRIKDEAAQAIRDGFANADEDLEDVDLSDALGTAAQALDSPRRRGHDERPTNPWGFFLWRSISNDIDRLDQWRAALVAAFWRRGVIANNIGVGYSRGMEPWVVAQVGTATVIFLHEDEVPTEAQAEAAADQIINK